MAQHILATAASFFHGISEHSESVEVKGARWQIPLFVSGLSEADNGGVMPGQDGRGEGYVPEREGAEDAADQSAL